jgi:enamine deaminase RidA (YjgF/YER057c/UK114 family)
MPPVRGSGYTHVIRIGDWVLIAGQTAGDMDGSIVGVGDPAAQTKQVYARLGRAMESVGGKLEDIVTSKAYITDVNLWPAMVDARAGLFGGKPPTSTLLNISRLARPEFLIEVEAVGYLSRGSDSAAEAGSSVSRSRSQRESSEEVVGREEMANVEHSQPKGMSPNNNRYTHVVKVGPWVSIAGQTASDENGDVVGIGDPAAQTKQVFKNLTTAIESVGGTLKDIVKTTVYVVGEEHLDAIREARAGLFGDKPPTSTLLVISRLARPEFLLEIEAVAYVE